MTQQQIDKERVFAHLANVHDWRSPAMLVREVWGESVGAQVLLRLGEMRALLKELSQEDKVVLDRSGGLDVYGIVSETLYTGRGVWTPEYYDEDEEDDTVSKD